ncbi:DNA topoisomerase IV subunit A [Candidatus Clavichlamydia salmonicola]|uniref:DNA topoisomerase IV subunit A n=1 Tax=Candidatus Clavichlamydia salmonicola TaxID=469812 RepID=UPI001890C097|nr:DNA topoisomerase IV subunit A [Candidatus Clavichlamydia salmonicola]
MKNDIKALFKDHFLRYASYVILERAIPHLLDGLKPVQRRLLWALRKMHDGKMHKVANIAGQTMAFHPHGDAPIVEALVLLANKNHLIDTQGNFGNPLTGDPHAAARYIEARLSPLAIEVLFNPDLTSMIPSYDGRALEPKVLPAKIPLLLIQGAEGIAVGMTTKILPHNFCEVLEAQIAILENRPFSLVPDFPHACLMDASNYNNGKGYVSLRAKMSTPSEKTIIVNRICYNTTTESVIKSIEEAVKKGRLKIDTINDYTAEKIEIELHLTKGQKLKNTMEALYAFTECETKVHSQITVIQDDRPQQLSVNEILYFHTKTLCSYLQKELETAKHRFLEHVFAKTLEQIFVENRLYHKIEKVAHRAEIYSVLFTAFKPFIKKLNRPLQEEDLTTLLNMPIRKISRFDASKNEKELEQIASELKATQYHLDHLNDYAIQYLKDLLNKYGDLFPRKTIIRTLSPIDKSSLDIPALSNIKVFFDESTGMLGTKVSSGTSYSCSPQDRLILFYPDGVLISIKIPEKHYARRNNCVPILITPPEPDSLFWILYTDSKKGALYGKKIRLKKFIVNKEYLFITPLEKFLTINREEANLIIEVELLSKIKRSKDRLQLTGDSLPLVSSPERRGTKLTESKISKIHVIRGCNE